MYFQEYRCGCFNRVDYKPYRASLMYLSVKLRNQPLMSLRDFVLMKIKWLSKDFATRACEVTLCQLVLLYRLRCGECNLARIALVH